MTNVMERVLLDKRVGDCTAEDLVHTIIFCDMLLRELAKTDPRVEYIRRTLIADLGQKRKR